MVKVVKNPRVVTHRQQGEKIKGKEIITVYKRVLKYVFRYRLLFILGIIGIVLNSSIDASLTWSLKPVLDQGFIAKNTHFISMLPFFVIAAFSLRGFAAFLATFSISSISRNVIMVLRQQIFSQLIQLPARYYDKKTAGGLIATLIYNVDQVSAASASTLIILVRETCFIIGLLVVMMLISWKLTLLFFITAPFIAFTASFSSKRIRRYGRRVQTGMGDITHIAEEAIEGYRVIRTFGGQKYETDKFIKATVLNRRREMQLIFTNALASPLVQLIISVIIAVTIYLATAEVGNISAGGFASMLAAMLAILKPLKNITTINNTIQRGVVGAEGIFELLDEEIEKDQGRRKVARVKGDIVFKDVNFAYASNPNKNVLNHISLTVKAGQTYALVGQSGSGKTTLVNLLPRFYDEFSGDISIDGINVRDFTLESLRHQFAFVSQNVTLFNDTIGHNIAYGRFAHVSEDEIIKAAKAANAWEFIKDLPEGLNTLIGDNGLLLSGGQRQRIAIARALLKDAPILILDEATSALDTESERRIQEALPRLIANRTTLVIAHRLSTIENADCILVLKQGRIIETGSHQQLIHQGGEYAKLHAMQFSNADTSEKSNQTKENAEAIMNSMHAEPLT